MMITKITPRLINSLQRKVKPGLFAAGLLLTFFFASAQTRDYGDAPDSYATSTAVNGPSHLPLMYNAIAKTASLMLGSRIDIESDGIPSALATGDNLADINDEDAISRFPILIPGSTTYSVTLSVTNTTGAGATVSGWIDFNKSGTFEAGEFATATVASGATTVTLIWSGFPAVANFGYIYARFRIAANAAEISLPTGAAASGEVEDHRFFIGRPVSGTVFNDIDRNTRINVGPENFTSLPAPLYVYTVQGGVVVDSAHAAANGTYTLRAPAGQASTIELSTVQYPIGYVVNAMNIIDHTPPTGWVTTGENISGTNTGNGDLSPDGILSVSLPNGVTSLAARNFGITCKRAGTSASTDICASETSVMPLSEFLEDEDAGGTWTQLTGSGIIFNAGAGTIQLTGTATTSTFQYTMPATTNCTASSSIVTIVIRAIPVHYQSITICQGQSVCVVNPGGTGRTLQATESVCYSTSGVYSDTLVAAGQYGCDSIVVTTLTVVPPPTLTVAHASCSAVGSVTISAPVGAGYTYSKDNISYQSSPEFANLVPGPYTFYVKNSATTCVTSASTTVLTTVCGSLPVTLVSFDAYKTADAVALVWATATEQNNKGFEVEHSTDGINWKTIGMVHTKASNGNSNTKLEYGYTDNVPVTGNNFYRLKQVDFDGKTVYSAVKQVTIRTAGSITVYPNPVAHELTVEGVALKGSTVTIFNAMGQHLSSKIIQSNEKLVRLNVSQLTGGVYYIVVTNEDKKVILSQKFFKQ
jgi:hypothetical protein